MLPGFAMNNAPNSAWVHFKAKCNFRNCVASSMRSSNVDDLVVGKFRVPVTFSKRSLLAQLREGVACVFGWCYPLKICVPIVGSVSVEMIYLSLIRKRSVEKSKGYKPMDKVESSPRSCKQCRSQISVVNQVKFKDFTVWSRSNVSVITSYSSEIRDRVKAFVVGYCFPNLRRGILFRHTRLSVQRLICLGVQLGLIRRLCADLFITTFGCLFERQIS